jgi:hypothetical protein
LGFGYQDEQKKLVLRELENFNSSEMSTKIGSWKLQKFSALVGLD